MLVKQYPANVENKVCS